MQSLERRARVDRGVLEAELLEHVHHEIGSIPRGAGIGGRARVGRAPRLRVAELVGLRGPLDAGTALDRRGFRRRYLVDDQAGGAHGGALEEVTTFHVASSGG